MLGNNFETLNQENDYSNESRKIGIYEKYIYNHPMVLKFDYSLFKKPNFIINDENNNPLFKFNKKNTGKILDMNDNVILNFRLEIVNSLDMKLHTYVDNEIFNKNIIEISRIDKYRYQLILLNNEKTKIKLLVIGENSKNLKIYYYKDLEKVEICDNSYNDGENTLRIKPGVDILLAFSVIFSILQLHEANNLFLGKPLK
ncbi:hypothetical protein H8356DRAFT_1311914 [Neocallimastix lanati (nom. inval.)]|jgi:hypothetical protein|uniref:Tubby C-terminal domain-containing protein n=1 Tax=Neocallimastix californiae TaxID=1754190 RepID=A0A1Y2CD51_9FUNG|nr:hypothetical protein H8356DRAFT_1311914 [Neocallimastix sp. JGI-2020a]ORY44981.1 hypothetical protein LY90DRAFT_703600 [Neocallimastix californiae]|eukprot:ORY44981.1 hypothetical protein LY90DRAFT_703600 [Neocallimastix californiae]